MDLTSYLLGKKSGGGSPLPTGAIPISAGENTSTGSGYVGAFEKIPELVVEGTSCTYMFYDYYGKTIPKITGTDNVTSMYRMFYTGRMWEITLDCNTSNVTTMDEMFSQTSLLKKVDISKLDTSKVNDTDKMFYATPRLAVIDISNLDLQNIRQSNNQMFNGCGTGCKQTDGAYADGIPYVYVKNAEVQNYIVNGNSNFRPNTWTTANVVVKGSE